jgi:hypothetical protein
MNLFSTILKAFGKERPGPTEADKGWAEGYRSFQRGKEHYLAGGKDHTIASHIQQALDCFDSAIALGFEGGGIYGLRGSCLQILGFDLDEPSDCNLFFMRSGSRGAVGDLRGRVSDLKEAIRLAAADNTANRSYDALANERGYRNGVAAMFTAEMCVAEQDVESQEFYEQLVRKSKRPGLADHLGPDIVSRRRANAKRRATGG